MTIDQVRSAQRLNAIANDPAVRPWLGGEGEIDITPLVEDGENFVLETIDGGFIYQHLGGHLYEVHSIFLPDAPEKVEAARAGLDYMFTSTECLEVVTKVPAPNKAALGMVRACGFDKRFARPGGWSDGQDFTVYGLTLDRWAQGSKAAWREGQAFHALLESALGHENHPEDLAHDHAAGAAALMYRAGFGVKAAWSYNRWAMVAGYHMIYPQADGSMHVGNAVVGLKNGQLEVIECL